MRYLMELGSPNSMYYTVFCCSHIIIAFFIFMVNSKYIVFILIRQQCACRDPPYLIFQILDLSLTLFSLFFELFIIFYRDVPDHIWAIFHGVSLISMVSGFIAICVGLEGHWGSRDNPIAILVFGCRVLLILGVTIARFIISIREFTKKEEPTLQELMDLFQIVPVVMYTIGIFLTLRLFSYTTGRYRGYHDVDDDLRLEIRR
ncbi:hypothetical protein CAEBREN_28013 [Caenorhabditis brenneri]|uniref:Uncharacterized protein n=1 Tax=Caenorhabditis brenneri TaxID=135651 RepID=G0PAU1_CAEBE|nr:hypothetical protein CAEBREN_28013 [Caenorhabditis brenneri]